MNATATPEFLRSSPWISCGYTPPPAAVSAKGMLSWDERIMLSWLTAVAYRGRGKIVELGVFLGSSTVSLASGLAQNPAVACKTACIHAFDKFRGAYEEEFIRSRGLGALDEDGGFLGLYENEIAAHRDAVVIHQGDINAASWSGQPVEILFVDILKSPGTVDAVARNFFPHLIPGESVVVMQDYNDPVLPYSAVLMEHFADFFEYAGETMRNSVLFVNTRPVPPAMLEDFSYAAMPRQLILHHLMEALPKRPTFVGRECLAHQISRVLGRPGN